MARLIGIQASHRRFMRITSCLTMVSLLVAGQNPAYANVRFEQDHSLGRSKPIDAPVFTPKEPVVLTADDVEYDQQNDVVMASGNVQVVQGETVLIADTVMYDQGRNQVQAMGHISILEPSGDVYFADSLELQDDLKSGVVHQFKARLSDGSIMVANAARKVDENITDMFKIAYTPCKCEKDGKPVTLAWSIKAEKATMNETDEKVRYENATFNVAGVPTLYTPYFSHSTPGAENQSGLLVPEFQQSKNLGAVYKQPVYYAIAPDRDATFTPIITTKEGPVMVGDYRQAFDNGMLHFDGSVTNAQNRDSLGNQAAGHEVRGHYDATGNFIFDKNYDWGFDVHRASDDTYLHLYDFSNETVLTSKVYAEGFNFVGDNDRNYASVQGLSFQGLTGQDDTRIIPTVAPLANFTWQSNPGWNNSRLSFDANTMLLYREVGAQSRRVSTTAGWKLPYISDDGQVIEFDAQMRTDIYDVADVPIAPGRSFSGITGREVPQGSVTWRLPLVNRFETSSLLIEPVGNFTISPGGGNPSKIPNEDSLLPDFTDANLFSTDRFAGSDRIENGPRMSYGVRGQAQLYSSNYIDMLLGQQYRIINDPNFPISNDLTSHFSDYVGKVGVTVQPVSLGYRFRIDKDDLSSSRSEVDAGVNYYPVNISGSYLSLRDDPILASKEVIAGTGTLNLTQEWLLTANGTMDLQRNQAVTAYGGVIYKNECVNLTTMLGKDYTHLLDIKPSMTFWIRVSLKNLE